MVAARLSVTDSTGFAGFVDTDTNFTEVWTYLTDIDNAMGGEATLAAKITDIDSNIAALTVGTGCPVSANDANPGYLNGKLVAGTGISLTEGSDGGDETLTIAQTDNRAHNLQDNNLQRANLLDTSMVTNAIGSIGGGTQDIDLELGNSVSGTVDTSTTTFTFSNATASDELCGFVLHLTNGGSQTVNWPASVDWEGGSEPTLTTSGVDILIFITIDGGTTWHGRPYALDSK